MVKTFIRQQPWFLFLALGLMAQQANMLTYKLGGMQAVPPVFLTYSFFSQAVCNLILMLFFRNRGFPVAWSRHHLWPVLAITGVYILNEMLFMTIFRAGAPYALATAIFSVCSLLMMVLFGIGILKEKMNRIQIIGIIVAVFAIIMIRMG